MNIIFICGSLEPGKDGVGDYTRILAEYLLRQNVEVLMIAYNDYHCKDFFEGCQYFNGTKINAIRFPEKFNENRKITLSKSYIDNFCPDWISLQYVPYSFHAKGLPFRVIRELKKIGKNSKWHIMFHELWIGMNTGPHSIKTRIISFLQQQVVEKLITELHPAIINTHSTLYLIKLKKIVKNIRIEQLHLFGNIPVEMAVNKNVYEDLNMIIFGGVRDTDRLQIFIMWCKKQQQILNKNITIHFVGKGGIFLNKWISALKEFDIKYMSHGFLEDTAISHLFGQMQVGISTTPYLLIEKSGAVAAMLDHSLPVICVGKSWTSNEDVKIDLPVFDFNETLNLSEVLRSNTKEYLGKHKLIQSFLDALQTHKSK